MPTNARPPCWHCGNPSVLYEPHIQAHLCTQCHSFARALGTGGSVLAPRDAYVSDLVRRWARDGLVDHGVNKDDVVARRAAGQSIRSIAQHYGVTTSAISHVLRHEPHRQQLRALGVSTRGWNVLKTLGVIRRTETPDALTREILTARMQAVDLEAIGDMKGVGHKTMWELRTLAEATR